MVCPKCGKLNVDSNRFCGECGARLREAARAAAPAVEGRKQVSVFFSDVSGYTAMSERLDAEEVKDIMQRIFSAAAAVVKRYDGQIDKFIGDCVMVVFGSPTAHDDDPVRALHAALEIHALVEGLNTPGLEARIGRRLAMHTGVNTGMVVVGELDIERGSEKILGDTVNVASRLAGVADSGEIVVGRDTYLAAARHFEFAELPRQAVKGKAEELEVYRLLGHRTETDGAARPRGLRSELVGRDRELALMLDAVRGLDQGREAVVFLSGEAGSGKSRLVAEAKVRAGQSNGYAWRHAFAEAHTGNTAYALWIDFLRRLLAIEDADSRDAMRAKLTRLAELPGFPADLLPFAGALYAIPSPETQGVDPGHLKNRIQECIRAVLVGVAASGKAVFCLEDLHWADPSSLDILRDSLRLMTHPAVFVLVHRPNADLSALRAAADGSFRTLEVRLSELGPQDGERMIASLLGSEGAPGELLRQVAGSAAGNPFYIEEIVNNLIETGALTRSGDAWKLTRTLTGSDVPLTVQSVIEARIDRLEPRTRRVLQTASVIGRTFLYSLLRLAIELDAELDACLDRLQAADVIRVLAGQPDLAYLFKHVLLQEVAYNSLLHKDQRAFHLRIAQIMESVFRERTEEYCEAIAYHYQRSGSREKAVEYLTRAGRKSMASYAAEEADAFFRKAYELVTGPEGRMERHEELLIRLLTEWGFAHYSLGTLDEWVDNFEHHLAEADSVEDQGLRALYYAELGYATTQGRVDLTRAHDVLSRAVSMAEECGDRRALAYAHCWLASVCATRGDLRDAVEHGSRGMDLAASFPDDPYLYGKSGYGKACGEAVAGHMARARETAEAVRAHGEKVQSPRCVVLAHAALGQGYLYNGDPRLAVESLRMALDAAPEPFYRSFSFMLLAGALIEADRLDEAEAILESDEARLAAARSRTLELGMRSYRSLLLFRRGALGPAFMAIEGIRSAWGRAGAPYMDCYLEYSIGTVYARMLGGGAEVGAGVVLRNLPFLLTHLPFAHRRALQCFERSLAIARELAIDPLRGRSALQLGLLLRRRNREKARAYLTEAVEALGRTDLAEETAKATEALRSL